MKISKITLKSPCMILLTSSDLERPSAVYAVSLNNFVVLTHLPSHPLTVLSTDVCIPSNLASWFSGSCFQDLTYLPFMIIFPFYFMIYYLCR
jgi:hypothetical protein